MQLPGVDFRSSADIDQPSDACQETGGRAVSIRRCICDISGSYPAGTTKSEFLSDFKVETPRDDGAPGPVCRRI